MRDRGEVSGIDRCGGRVGGNEGWFGLFLGKFV